MQVKMDTLERIEESLESEVESMPFLAFVSQVFELFHYLTERIQEQFLIPVIQFSCFTQFSN